MIPDNELPAERLVLYKNNNLYVQETELGIEGVFSFSEIKKGDIIEYCPLIVYTENDVEFLKFTNVYNYYSFKQDALLPGFLALGYGSIYNHNSPSNAEYNINIKERTLIISAITSIKANVEITINYNGKFNDTSPVVFQNKNEIYEFSVTLC